MANFQIAVEKTFIHEGGKVNDPQDPGGCTSYGISQKAYPDFDIPNLTVEQAKAIYYRDYWHKMYLDAMKSQSIAEKLFDLSVLCGIPTVTKSAQRVCGVSVDGIFGPATFNAINNMDPDTFLEHFKTDIWDKHFAEIIADNPVLMKYFHGWNDRVMS